MMFLAVYLNPDTNTFLHSIISLFTWSDATHTELVFSDGKSLVVEPFGGTHMVDKSHDLFRWAMIPLIWVDEESEAAIRERAEYICQNNPSYDFTGALFGWCSSRFDDSTKWFCSELCAYLLFDDTPELDEQKWYSPGMLWKEIAEIYELKKTSNPGNWTYQ